MGKLFFSEIKYGDYTDTAIEIVVFSLGIDDEQFFQPKIANRDAHGPVPIG